MNTPRRFLLSDAIVLVAATAIGLFVFLPYYPVTWLDWNPPFPPAPKFYGWVGRVWNRLVLASPIVMAWTLAILGLRLRRPRPRLRRLLRQPGFVAGLVAAMVLVVRLFGFATMCARVVGRPALSILTVRRTGGGGALRGLPFGNLFLFFEVDHFLGTMALVGTSVAASWIFLLASGKWRPERGWIDRAGRVLGWFWIATLPLTGWWDFHLRF
jgi:hypothetical protein